MAGIDKGGEIPRGADQFLRFCMIQRVVEEMPWVICPSTILDILLV